MFAFEFTAYYYIAIEINLKSQTGERGLHSISRQCMRFACPMQIVVRRHSFRIQKVLKCNNVLLWKSNSLRMTDSIH